MAEVTSVTPNEQLMSVDPSTLVSEEVNFTDDPTFDQRVAEQSLYTSAPPPIKN